MYLAYTYFVKNKITNQFYYGSRKTDRLPADDLWIKYFTSSKVVKALIKEFGSNSFDIQIIEYSTNYDKCYWLEQALIKENISQELCINRHYIDPISGNNKFSTAGIPCSQETKDKISEQNTGKKYEDMFSPERVIQLKLQKSKEMAERNKKNKGKPDEERIGVFNATAKKASLLARFGNKTYEEIYGKERANVEKQKRGIHQKHRAGKTYEEMYGVETALLAKKKKSESMKKTLALKRAKALLNDAGVVTSS